MKSLINILKNNIWYVVIGASIVTAGAGIAITQPWNSTDKTLEVGTWEVQSSIAFNSTIATMIRIENKEQALEKNMKALKEDISNMIETYHCAFTNKDVDATRCGDNMNVLGLNKATEKFEVSKLLYDALEYGIQMNKETNGYFSIAQGNIFSLWKDELLAKKGKGIDLEPILADVLNRVPANMNDAPDETTITLLKEGDKYFAQKVANVKIDLGGIAKAIAADNIFDLVADKGYTRYYINSGFSSWRVSGKFNSESGRIGVFNPSFIDECGSYEYEEWCRPVANGQYFKALEIEVSNASLGTSGDYADNNFVQLTENGRRYHHIINPHDGMPSENIRSTTIISDSAADSDVWSTALMAMGKTKAEEFFKSNPSLIATYYDGENRGTEFTQLAIDSNRFKKCRAEIIDGKQNGICE